jgi:hypothetical protein
MGKLTHTQFKSKNFPSTEKPLQLVHMDLCGPSRKEGTGKENYFMLIIDDYSRLTWVAFLKEKSEALEKFKVFKALIENQTGKRLKAVRSDRGGEFSSGNFKEFCDKHGIKREYTIPKTPQQNGVVERQNRSVQQMERSMMNERNIPQTYWVEAIHIAVHILNKSHLRPHSDKTPYELWFGRPASIKHFKVFGSKCYIKNNDEDIGKYDDRADEGIFLGYATNSKGYRCYNKRLHKLVDCIDIKVDQEIPVRNISSDEPRTIKRIFKYLKGTMTYGLWYPRNQNFQLIAYSDADWANCVDERKSTSGGAFFLGDSLVAWLSKKQGSISLSTTEAEYIAAATCCTQILWMIQTLTYLKITYTDPIPIHCDNTSAISVSKNPILHSKTKHIPIKYHFLREQVTNRIVQLNYIPSTEQIADIFTKPLAATPFGYLRQKLGVIISGV